jgi:hypothetical protein
VIVRRASTAARWIHWRMLRDQRDLPLVARTLVEVANEVCAGRIVLTHEGGYSTAHVPFCGLAVMEELSGISTGVVDPFLDSSRDRRQALRPSGRGFACGEGPLRFAERAGSPRSPAPRAAPAQAATRLRRRAKSAGTCRGRSDTRSRPRTPPAPRERRFGAARAPERAPAPSEPRNTERVPAGLALAQAPLPGRGSPGSAACSCLRWRPPAGGPGEADSPRTDQPRSRAGGDLSPPRHQLMSLSPRQ